MVAFMNDPRQVSNVPEETADTVLVLVLRVFPCEAGEEEACFRVQYEVLEVPREALAGLETATVAGEN